MIDWKDSQRQEGCCPHSVDHTGMTEKTRSSRQSDSRAQGVWHTPKLSCQMCQRVGFPVTSVTQAEDIAHREPQIASLSRGLAGTREMEHPHGLLVSTHSKSHSDNQGPLAKIPVAGINGGTWPSAPAVRRHCCQHVPGPQSRSHSMTGLKHLSWTVQGRTPQAEVAFQPWPHP